ALRERGFRTKGAVTSVTAPFCVTRPRPAVPGGRPEPSRRRPSSVSTWGSYPDSVLLVFVSFARSRPRLGLFIRQRGGRLIGAIRRAFRTPDLQHQLLLTLGI